MKTVSRLSAMAIGLLLSACALGPDYQRPAIDAPERVRGDTAQGASYGDLGWREIYRDPALSALLRQALERNLDLRMAAARVEQARASAGVSRLAQLPQIDASGAASRRKLSESSVSPGAERLGEQGSAGVALSWELDLWGRLRRLNESARADLLASEYAQRGVSNSLVADVATAYFSLQSFDRRLDITRRTITTRVDFLKLTRAQYERGVISGLDVASAEAQLAVAQANLPALERSVAQTENLLSLLLGGNPAGIPRSVSDTSAPPMPATPAGLPSALLERRPDILQSEQALVAANARIGAAKAALFPTLSLTGSLGVLSGDVSNLFSSGAENWSAGVGLLQPLLNADRNLYQVDLANARKREALLGYEKTVRNAFREVADSLVSREKSQEALAAQQLQVDALRRAVDISKARYKSGYSSYFDVISADRDLFNAELSHDAARLDAQLSLVQLYRALGGGWQTQGQGGDNTGQ
ncbi:efflux transporter outer membrane subunit [Solimonas sp. K1W22B-7]|uniref:efflux transporter outer membrane subunit n=1 Tax=Solimonas sp. K1W22B-7 TaxID=2303331 RepID=UPI000E3377FE|nr:efflux transporter outer membrane subunit [Solimonas sp. K1W22B-7]AXQ29548.1 efflux transporter outer membrane subunit [Solimonas sp. K1W22B-7]